MFSKLVYLWILVTSFESLSKKPKYYLLHTDDKNKTLEKKTNNETTENEQGDNSDYQYGMMNSEGYASCETNCQYRFTLPGEFSLYRRCQNQCLKRFWSTPIHACIKDPHSGMLLWNREIPHMSFPDCVKSCETETAFPCNSVQFLNQDIQSTCWLSETTKEWASQHFHHHCKAQQGTPIFFTQKMKRNDNDFCSTMLPVKNIEDLTAIEVHHLLQGFRALHATHEYDQNSFKYVAGFHGAPQPGPCGTGYCCSHEDKDVLPWHRLFVTQMQNALTHHRPEAIIPYWDWTTGNLPHLVSQPIIQDPITGEFMENPLYKSFIPHLFINTTRNPTFAQSNFDFVRSVLQALESNNWGDFSSAVLLPHNEIHMTVGGSMAPTDTSAYDPVFYMHHRMVDLIWAVFQELKPWIKPIDSYYLETKHEPFDNDILNQDAITRKNHRTKHTFDNENNLCFTFLLDINSNRPVFGGLSLAQIMGSSRRESGQRRVAAGIVLRSLGITGKIKFNICNNDGKDKEDDCSIPGGEIPIFGGKDERPYVNEHPSKVDVTETLKKEGIEDMENVRFKITSLEDISGKHYPIDDIYQPVTVSRPEKSDKEKYTIFLDKTYVQPPVLRIPKYVTFTVDSQHDKIKMKRVSGKKSRDGRRHGGMEEKAVDVAPKKELNPDAGKYVFFDSGIDSQSGDYDSMEKAGDKIIIIVE